MGGITGALAQVARRCAGTVVAVPEGEITSFEAFALEPHGGDLGGFALIRGDAGKLAQLRYSREFQRLNNRSATVVENFGVVAVLENFGVDAAIPPDQVQQYWQTYQEDITDLLS